ncbi:MAG: M12 family metallopeptidase [Parvularculaceae bacterium]
MKRVLAWLLILAVLAPKPLLAAAFYDDLKWPTVNGYTVIKVCYFVSRTGTGSVTQLMTRLRRALAGWEQGSSLRFTGFEDCQNLTDAQKNDHIVLKLSFDRSDATNSAVGTNAKFVNVARSGSPPYYSTALNAWGRDFASNVKCSEGDFRCIEQYGLHEFGHAIGFYHEFDRADRPAACAANTGGASPIGNTITSIGQPWQSVSGAVTVFGPYDRTSIMSYDNDCTDYDPHDADSKTVRFGQSVLSAQDRLAVQAVYPEPAHADWAIGVIPQTAGDCGGNEPITVYVDAEDTDPESRTTGWTGAIRADRNVWLQFCRVKLDPSVPAHRDFFHHAAKGEFMVLKLGKDCPVGHTIGIGMDDEDGDDNENYVSGNIAPGSQDRNTKLQFCVYDHRWIGNDDAPFNDFPDLGFEYGVFGAPQLGSTSGSVFIDNEDDGNINTFSYPLSKTPAEQTGFKTEKGLIEYPGLFKLDRNTLFYTVKVR